MALSFRFPISDERVVIGVGGAFGPEVRARAFADMVRQDVARIDDENARAAGARLPYDISIDRSGADFSRITVKSEIVARWRLGHGAVEFIWRMLRNSGPHKSGAYRASMRCYADGREIKDPTEAAGAREVMFLSIVPYARKIERGQKGYSPGKVYEAVAQAAKARYGKAAIIKFTYATPAGPAPALTSWAARSATAASQRKRKGRDNPLRQPAILIFLEAR
ncbi:MULTISPECIES: hypothetical protein [Methylosinus]|uniref:Uncharacterized protein n=1 Tax=Methylosinus trichosporium (strain ATCC 35070 / NCIMB 11131 / UNIQEM 75 / OB3b) TaxID=595536 RepID=A0A2D2CYB1_METT3|nr:MULTISPECIES: hypothetical protein [Methylosinus]ATQ67732.1 hypothetical protein CQW49_07380 [Methylosinus trichosporium OB3b]OBS51160.1 hypothetical protein A8B73_17730 [Methylosinus sp. 3S-1]